MAYTLNEYLQYSDNTSTRVEMYPNNTVAANLLAHYKSQSQSVIVLSISDCMPVGTVRLPMPNTLFEYIDEKINNQKARVVIVGVDAYLSLLSESNATAFFVALKGRIDNGRQNAAYILSERNNPHFDAPRYEEALSVVKIIGDSEYCEPPVVEVISDKWVKPDGNLTNYNALLKRLGDFLPTEKHTLVLKDLTSEQAGLSNNVSFFLNIHRIAERFYGIRSDLKTATLESLIEKAVSNGLPPETYIETEFGKANIDVRLALKRLLELPDDDLWEAYVGLLQRRIPSGSYMVKVLISCVTHSNLLRKYVIDVLVPMLHNLNIEKFAAERAEALSGVTAESLIVEFIGQTKEIESAAKFLNCKTVAERIEIIRRVSKLDLVTGLPGLYQRLYPALAYYLSTEFDYGTNDLTEYFKEYRRLKITNTVSERFVNRAFETVLPNDYPSRESLLADLRVNSGVALLVVDGMGAEYFPLLLAMAKRLGMNIESYDVASAKMPTSTDYNRISWDGERTLKAVKVIDTDAHDGAAKHEDNPPERNIEKVLRTFDDVFNRIAMGLSQFNRVVVTSDHGTSRLAVLAYKKGLSKKLPWDGEPFDWRYSLAPANVTRPPELEQQYHPDRDETYWIVRGYNRLPKSGGKPNELHGGASLEERLVPVVVFTRAKTAIQPKHIAKEPTEQIVDKKDFDI